MLGQHRLGGGPHGTGNRCSLKYTRQLIDSIHDGSLADVEWEEMPVFGLMQPKSGIKGVRCSRPRGTTILRQLG